MKKLRQWFIPFIEKHVRTYHSGCECLEGSTTTPDGVRKIYYQGEIWVIEKAGEA